MMDEYKEIIKMLNINCTEKQKSLLSLRSIENFITDFETLKEEDKAHVQNLIKCYFDEIKRYNYNLDKKQSSEIGDEYIMKIAVNYVYYSGYKMIWSLSTSIILGLLIDMILFLFLPIRYPMFIFSSLYLIRYFYVRLYLVKKKKAFAVGY